MRPCLTQGMCSPHGGCRPTPSPRVKPEKPLLGGEVLDRLAEASVEYIQGLEDHQANSRGKLGGSSGLVLGSEGATMEEVTLTEAEVPAVTIEKDICGTVRVLLAYPSEEPFEFVQIRYDHRYTSNASQNHLARQIVWLVTGEGRPPEPRRKKWPRPGYLTDEVLKRAGEDGERELAESIQRMSSTEELLRDLAEWAPEGICAPTTLQGFAVRAKRLVDSAKQQANPHFPDSPESPAPSGAQPKQEFPTEEDANGLQGQEVTR